MPVNNFPPIDSASLAHTQTVAALIREQIQAAGGAIRFVDFMRLALYAPGLGYYSAGARKFGAEGDFVTAPELSPLFSQCLARQCRDVLQLLGGGEILEFGAGQGTMAADILAELERLDSLPERYWILDISADLRARQRETLQQRVPHLLPRVDWLETWPEQPLRGVMLANEVMDAMPVQRFHLRADGEVEELWVGVAGDHFVWQERAADARLSAAVAQLQSELAEPLPAGYISEYNPALPGWIQGIGQSLQQGLALLIDYGFPRREFYHPQRSQGTLMCHFRQHAHDDPLCYPGIQDITAHVDFTAVAEAALAADLQVAGFTSQGQFLLHAGLQDLMLQQSAANPREQWQFGQQIKKLLLPEEMGELFKVMALSRGLPTPLPAFREDRRNRL